MIYYCNCHKVERKGRIKKDGTRAVWMLREFKSMKPTKADSEGICLECGHYAVANYDPDLINIEQRITDYLLNERKYKFKRSVEIGDFFASQGVFTYTKSEAYNE